MSKQIILIIDDSKVITQLFRSILTKSGYNCLIANSGTEALELIKNINRLDLVICDLNMPNMTGLEFIDIFQKQTKFKDTPTILLTTEIFKKLFALIGLTIQIFTPNFFASNFLSLLFSVVNIWLGDIWLGVSLNRSDKKFEAKKLGVNIWSVVNIMVGVSLNRSDKKFEAKKLGVNIWMVKLISANNFLKSVEDILHKT